MKSVLNAVALVLLMCTAVTLAAGEITEDKPVLAPDIRGDLQAATRAWNLIEQGALLIDVRSVEEFEMDHIDGAINIPHTRIDELAAAIGDDHSRSTVLYCGSGRRVNTAMKALEERGYEELFNATGLTALQATKPE